MTSGKGIIELGKVMRRTLQPQQDRKDAACCKCENNGDLCGYCESKYWEIVERNADPR
jgi:hypothetical protein